MRYTSFDGVTLAVTEMGAGPPLLLLHGLFSSADTNWIRYGTARRLVDAGFRLILPDFRGHGASDCPADPAAWPADVLARDIEALIAHLGLGDDLVIGGYSLGARTCVRLLARGLAPRAAMLAGMGLQGITGGAERARWFLRMIDGRGSWPRGSAEFVAESFMTAGVKEPAAMIHLLRAQLDTSVDVVAGLRLPVAVICGTDDQDNGSAAELAEMFPAAFHAAVPGNHMSAVTRPELAQAMIGFVQQLR